MQYKVKSICKIKMKSLIRPSCDGGGTPHQNDPIGWGGAPPPQNWRMVGGTPSEKPLKNI